MKRKWILRARQKDIVEWYREDIAKRAGDRALVVKRIFDLIPHKLSGRNKRFMAKSIEGKAQLPQRLGHSTAVGSEGLQGAFAILVGEHAISSPGLDPGPRFRPHPPTIVSCCFKR